MARLQDFQTVTPASADNMLIVQSQGQGLATVEAMRQKMAGDTDIDDLKNTNISSLAVGQVLAYNGSKWINSNSLKEFATWATSTTSFTDACSKIGIYSGIGAVLDSLKTNINSYTNATINNRVDISQGPNFFMIFGKANNSYFTGILLSYFYNDLTRQPIMFTYSNGTYAVKKF